MGRGSGDQWARAARDRPKELSHQERNLEDAEMQADEDEAALRKRQGIPLDSKWAKENEYINLTDNAQPEKDK